MSEPAVFKEFIRQAMADSGSLKKAWESSLDQISAATYFILDQSNVLGVDRFVRRTMPRLLQQLSHSTEQVENVLHGQVRGRVLWNATYKARLTEEYNPSIFVCGEVHHRFTNPENQLLKFLVHRIAEGMKAIPPLIRQGECVLLMRGYEDLLITEETAGRLEALETDLNRLLGSVRFREIAAPGEITEFHLLRAKTSRLEEYHEAAELYSRYKHYVLDRNWTCLAESAHRCLPLPARLDDPSRCWIGLAAALYRTAI